MRARIAHSDWTGAFDLTALIAALSISACSSQVRSPQAHEPRETQQARLTSSPSNGHEASPVREGSSVSPFDNQYGDTPDPATVPRPVPAAGPPPAEEFASDDPVHFRNKVVDRPTDTAATGTPPAVSDAYMAKQREYLARWEELRRTSAGLSEEEQESRRAQLKRTVLGD